jgi:hypothetical protein
MPRVHAAGRVREIVGGTTLSKQGTNDKHDTAQKKNDSSLLSNVEHPSR